MMLGFAAVFLTVAPSVKLIQLGWDTPAVSEFIRSLANFDKLPFDGAGVTFSGTGDIPRPFERTFSRTPWPLNLGASDAQRLRAAIAASQGPMRSNFLVVHANPGDVDWFDDDGFKEIVNHMQLAAKLACTAGLKGLIFDPEPYSLPNSAFAYSAQKSAKSHTFAEYAAKARERGQRVMAVMAAEFPDLEILVLHLYTSSIFMATSDGWRAPVGQTYDLLFPFVEGMQKSAPKTVSIIDGNESGYYNASAVDYITQRQSQRARSNQGAKSRVAHPIYLDAYRSDSPHPVEKLAGSRLARMYSNLRAAIDASDDYVWIYGEKGGWWPQTKFRPWEKKVQQTIAAAKTPNAWRSLSLNHEANAIRNGSFTSQLEGWTQWQDEQSHGSITWNSRGSASFNAVSHGCVCQSIAVSPGEIYGVSASVRRQGEAEGALAIGYKDSSGNWIFSLHKYFGPSKPSEAWSEFQNIIEVPNGVSSMVIMPTCLGSGRSTDKVEFDDIILQRIRFD